MKPELEKVSIEEMEKLILLADDVLTQVGWHFIYYNEQGISLEELCRREDGSVDEARWWNEVNENRKREALSMMVKRFLHEEVSVTEVRYEGAESILKRLEPLKSRVLGVFRHGAEQNTVMNETNYYADEAIPDKTLLELFAMRVRDRRLLFALQRERTRHDKL